MNYKLKITTGFSEDQKFTIDIEEAHKAYYLFRNPEKRGVFSNGVALIGKNIQSIAPDWHATMEWNTSHKLDGDDWNEINGGGVKDKMFSLMHKAETIALEIVKDETKLLLTTKNLSEILSERVKIKKENEKLKELTGGVNKLTK